MAEILIKGGATACAQPYEKSYYLVKHLKTFWLHARGICQSYGMEFASLETKAEADHFLGLCDKNIALFTDDYTHIGAITMVGKTDWYWVNSGKKVDYPIKWMVGQPDFYAANEFCLTVRKTPGDFSFNDLNCYGAFESKFICQKNEL